MRLLKPTIYALWTINVVYGIAHSLWPEIGDYDVAQRLTLAATVALTMLQLQRNCRSRSRSRSGSGSGEYRVGYWHGRADSRSD
ncbi:hypothetical protein [Streptosporangium sp. G12]